MADLPYPRQSYSERLEKKMKKQRVDKAELAERMETSRSAIDRILDPFYIENICKGSSSTWQALKNQVGLI